MSIRAVIGAQGAQTSTSAGRGLARYVSEYTEALVRLVPEMVAAVDLDPSMPRPAFLDRIPGLGVTGLWMPPGGGDLLYHVMSPFELESIDRIWPVWARSPDTRLVVTLHDLIAFVYGEQYLADPVMRTRYIIRLGMVRAADAVIAISEATANDAVDYLGIPRERIFVTYEDCSPVFAPRDRPLAEIEAELVRRLPKLRTGFTLYVGGPDYRKNLPVLFAAHARMPAELRARNQLVVSGKLLPDEHEALVAEAVRHGVLDHLLITGYVPDDVLRGLYQACACFVLPSLYEGFGLPALEAMRCDAPVLVADRTSLREVMPLPEARFDPADPDALASLMERCLLDEAFRERLRAAGRQAQGRFSWERVVEVTRRAYLAAGAGPGARPGLPSRTRSSSIS